MTRQARQSIADIQKNQNFLGEKFLIAFYRLASAVKIYQSNNAVLRDCAEEFMDIISQLILEEGSLELRVARGQFYLYEEKLVYQRENINVVKEMLDYFEHRMNPGFNFNSGIKDATVDQVLALSRLLNNAAKEKDPLPWLSHKLAQGPFPWVEMEVSSGDIDDNEDELKEMARKTYSYALSSVKEVSQKIVFQGRSGVRKIKRIVQNMVDFLQDDDSVLLGMSTIREYDDYTYTHSVNVAILSLCLGKRIGLSRVSLSWLGICGLVHDLGKLDVPQDILNKPGKLSQDEFHEMEKHPLKSVCQILRLNASRDLKTKILLPPLEHHMKYDSSGYPKVRRKQTISLFGRIISIADVYDALSSPRVYRPTAYGPDRALSIMLEGSGKDFDPILLKVFINMLGVYPVGTLLELDTGEKGLVVPPAEDTDKSRPHIALLIPDSQGGYQKGETVSLAQQDPGTGSYLRNIVSSHHPMTYGIQPAEFII